MCNKNGTQGVKNVINVEEKQITFTPDTRGYTYTDPSYHVPHFYELWGKWAIKDNEYWLNTSNTSRNFLKKAAHPKTGLMPDYAEFNGTPVDPWNGGHDAFRFDAWRNAMNVAVDYLWFAADKWEVKQSNRLLKFFYKEGIDVYGNQYTIDGKLLGGDHSLGLVSMNAVACIAATIPERIEFVERLWNAEPPQGRWRYYDGLLYMLALLNVSGNFRIYNPSF